MYCKYSIFQSRPEIWQEFASHLGPVIGYIIEFAKMLENFMILPQDEQIKLLKSESNFVRLWSNYIKIFLILKYIYLILDGVFEMAVLSMVLCYNSDAQVIILKHSGEAAVHRGDVVLPYCSIPPHDGSREVCCFQHIVCRLIYVCWKFIYLYVCRST